MGYQWRAALSAFYLADGVPRRNARACIADGAFFGLATGLTVPFLGPFVIALGGSDLQVGLVTAAPALAGLLGQLPAIYLTERSRTRTPVVVAYALVHRLFYLLFAALPFLVTYPRAWLLVLGLGLATVPFTISNTAWTTLMGEMFPGGARAQLFADRNMWAALATLAGTAVAGPLLDVLAPPWNWCLLFLLAFSAHMASYVYLTRLREEPPSALLGRRSVFALGDVGRDRNFMSFLLPMAVFYAGLQFAVPMYPIIYVRKLGLANSWIAGFSIISGVCSVLAYRYWGRVSDRRGSRFVFAWATGVHIIFPLAYAVAGSAYPILWWSVVGGVFGAALNLSLFNLLLDLSPAAERPRYVALYNLVVNGTTLVGPLLGVLAYRAWGLYVAMGISTLGRMLGVAWLLWSARTPVSSSLRSARGDLPA